MAGAWLASLAILAGIHQDVGMKLLTPPRSQGSPPAEIRFVVDKINDSGGITEIPGGVSDKMTKGFGTFVQTMGKVRGLQFKATTAKDAAYTLSGSVRKISDPAAEYPLICTLQLNKADNGGTKVLGYWSGGARTYLALSTVFGKDRELYPFGLMGELAKRAVDRIAVDRGLPSVPNIRTAAASLPADKYLDLLVANPAAATPMGPLNGQTLQVLSPPDEGIEIKLTNRRTAGRHIIAAVEGEDNGTEFLYHPGQPFLLEGGSKEVSLPIRIHINRESKEQKVTLWFLSFDKPVEPGKSVALTEILMFGERPLSPATGTPDSEVERFIEARLAAGTSAEAAWFTIVVPRQQEVKK